MNEGATYLFLSLLIIFSLFTINYLLFDSQFLD